MAVTRIAVDAMGGDHAPQEIVNGVLLAAAEPDIEILPENHAMQQICQALSFRLKYAAEDRTMKAEIDL